MPDELDGRLRAASSQVAAEILVRDIPEFHPSPRRGPLVAAMAAIVILGGGAIAWLSARAELDQAPITQTVTTLTDGSIVSSTISNGPTVITPGLAGEFIVPLNEAWNADGSLLLAYATGGPGDPAHRVYRSGSGELVGEFALSATDIEQVYWDPTDPERLLYLDRNQLVRLNVIDGESETVAEFAGCDSASATSRGSALSWNATVFAFRCHRSDGAEVAALYLLDNDRLQISGLDASGDAPLPLPSGEGLVLAGPDGTATVLRLDFTPTGVSFGAIDDAFWLSQSALGRDIMIAPSYDGPAPGVLVRYDLGNGTSHVVLGVDEGAAIPPSGILVSGSARLVPGRAALTVHPGTGSPISGKLLVIDLDSGEVISEIEHLNTGSLDPYWGSTFVSISPDGNRVLYSGDHGGAATGLSIFEVPDR